MWRDGWRSEIHICWLGRGGLGRTSRMSLQVNEYAWVRSALNENVTLLSVGSSRR